MLLLLCWSAFISTLTLTIFNGLNWLFPVMLFVIFCVIAIYVPDNRKTRAEESEKQKESV